MFLFVEWGDNLQGFCLGLRNSASDFTSVGGIGVEEGSKVCVRVGEL